MTKPCRLCGTFKPLEQFCKNSGCKGGRDNRCKECFNAMSRTQTQCNLCQAFIRKSSLETHQRSDRCKNRQLPYSKFRNSGEGSKTIVECPCQHWQCRKY